jgi:protein gp37
MGVLSYRNGFDLTLHERLLEAPLRWKRPQTVFVNSMSDLLHRDVPTAFILRAFDVMRQASWHRFQVLTKRSDRLPELDEVMDWPANVWMGVSVESPQYLGRIDHLRAIGARVRFLSLEPLLAALPELDLDRIDWVIVGGESGPGARPMLEAWALDIRDQCRRAQVPFFFKQWGGVWKKRTGRRLAGRTWNEMPVLADTAPSRSSSLGRAQSKKQLITP